MNKIIWNEIIRSPNQSAHVARTCLKQDKPTDMHTHNFAEVLFVLSGNGRQLTPDGSVTLNPGQALCFHAPTIHCFESRKGIDYINIAIPQSVLQKIAKNYPEVTTNNNAILSSTQTGNLCDLAMELGRNETSTLLRDHFLLTFFKEISLALETDTYNRLPQWLANGCRELEKPENFKLGAGRLAQLCGCTPEHVARELKKEMGYGPSDLVNRIRMEYAQHQLRFSGKTLLDISHECGYASLSHFHLIFRKSIGMTPRQCRIRSKI